MNRWMIATALSATAVGIHALLGTGSGITLAILLTAWLVGGIAHRTLAPVTVRREDRRSIPR